MNNVYNQIQAKKYFSQQINNQTINKSPPTPMQTHPQPPKSYSIIKNLLPSASLYGQTSQDYPQPSSPIELPPAIITSVNAIIHSVETSTVDELKKLLKEGIEQIDMLGVTGGKEEQGQGQGIGMMNMIKEDAVLMRLRQLAMVSDVLVQRMSEKYAESKGLLDEFQKAIGIQNRVTNAYRVNYLMKLKKKKNIQQSQHFQASQSTEKKPVFYNEDKEKEEERHNFKKTRKSVVQGNGKN